MAEKIPLADDRKGARTRIIVIVIVVIIALLAASLAGYFLKDVVDGLFSAEAESEKSGKDEVDARSYVTLEPPFIVNLHDAPRERLVQISMAILVRAEEVAAFLEKNRPMIRNNILLALAAQDPKDLLTAEGKEKLQATLLSEVRKVQKDLTGADSGIDELFFTAFVMQ